MKSICMTNARATDAWDGKLNTITVDAERFGINVGDELYVSEPFCIIARRGDEVFISYGSYGKLGAALQIDPKHWEEADVLVGVRVPAGAMPYWASRIHCYVREIEGNKATVMFERRGWQG